MAPNLVRRQRLVGAVDTATNTATVDGMPGIPYLGAAPRVGSTVWVDQLGDSDWLIVGAQRATSPDPIKAEVAAAGTLAATLVAYGDPTTGGIGPTISNLKLVAGQVVEIVVELEIEAGTSGPRAWMSYEITGPSTLVAADARAAKCRPAGANTGSTVTLHDVWTVPTSGTYQIQAKYRQDGTGGVAINIANRKLIAKVN